MLDVYKRQVQKYVRQENGYHADVFSFPMIVALAFRIDSFGAEQVLSLIHILSAAACAIPSICSSLRAAGKGTDTDCFGTESGFVIIQGVFFSLLPGGEIGHQDVYKRQGVWIETMTR